jgi:hypothetical protein
MPLSIKGSQTFLKGKRVQLMQKKEIMEETLQIKILALEMKAQKIRE